MARVKMKTISKAKVLLEMSVGLTPEIQQALAIAVDCQGIKASQYARIAIQNLLVHQGYLPSPQAKHQAAIASVQA